MLKNATWITYDQKYAESLPKYPCLDYRKTLELDKSAKKLTRATVYASAIGLYKISLNGKEITDTVFNPGWTNYQTRIQYQTYDVTSLIEDKNEISILSGNGWAVHFRRPSDYDHTAVIFALCLTFEDGSTQYFSTDESWDVYTSYVLWSHFYHGESVDFTANP
jgi:alpha-L-rhamnosidase